MPTHVYVWAKLISHLNIIYWQKLPFIKQIIYGAKDEIYWGLLRILHENKIKLSLKSLCIAFFRNVTVETEKAMLLIFSLFGNRNVLGYSSYRLLRLRLNLKTHPLKNSHFWHTWQQQTTLLKIPGTRGVVVRLQITIWFSFQEYDIGKRGSYSLRHQAESLMTKTF